MNDLIFKCKNVLEQAEQIKSNQYETIDSIAELCGVKRRVVQNWIKKLRDIPYAEITQGQNDMIKSINIKALKSQKENDKLKFTLNETILIILASGKVTLAKLLLENALTKNLKPIRLSMTDRIQESGINEKMHGFAYKSFTDLTYQIVLGMSAKKFREANNLDSKENVRDYLNSFQLSNIARIEKNIESLIDIGFEYQEIKEIMNNKFKLENKSENKQVVKKALKELNME